MVLQSIERWLILTESVQDSHIRSAAIEGLQSVHEAVGTGARQLTLTQGLPSHLQNVLRDMVNQWPKSHELIERLRCYDALVDVVIGMSLRDWRAKWIDSVGARTATHQNQPTINKETND